MCFRKVVVEGVDTSWQKKAIKRVLLMEKREEFQIRKEDRMKKEQAALAEMRKGILPENTDHGSEGYLAKSFNYQLVHPTRPPNSFNFKVNTLKK